MKIVYRGISKYKSERNSRDGDNVSKVELHDQSNWDDLIVGSYTLLNQ